MPDIKRILVPIDFSEPSARALTYALDLAPRFGASLLVLHVWEPPRFMGPEVIFYPPDQTQESVLQIIQSEAQRQTHRFVAEHAPNAGSTIDVRVDPGVPYAAIVEVAAAEDVDLIVMGTHGRTGLSHFFLGSVAERVVRHAPCPVLTIRERHGKPAGF